MCQRERNKTFEKGIQEGEEGDKYPLKTY